MIKNLLNADEEPPPGSKVVIEEHAAPESAQAKPPRAFFEIPEDARFFAPPAAGLGEETSELLYEPAAAPKNEPPAAAPLVEPAAVAEPTDAPPEKDAPAAESNLPVVAGTLFQSEIKQPTTAETIRRSGLAYSAAIVLFGSVVFMMILGWFADLLLGSSPWGIVGGIILGGLVGFIQFFRITAQIFK